jgi:fido (protein-threonine AMPylation protein)
VPGPVWNTDNPGDTHRIAANADVLVRGFAVTAHARTSPTVTMVLDWHVQMYAGCQIPSSQYAGAFRGDAARPHLVGYEVGLGPIQPDGLPEKVGVYSLDVITAVSTLVTDLARLSAALDGVLPVGTRPSTVAELEAVVGLIAGMHGEWVRIHPFANGNGRTARLWAAWLALRYSMPVFVSVKPRPNDVAYALAARASMGRPPTFVGDHSLARNVFTHLLALALLP